MFKKKFLLVVAVLVISLMGCGTGSETDEDPIANQDVNLESCNVFLNESAGLGPGSIGNVVQVIPHAHIDGPQNETAFYAFVNFKYKARDYVKYQVTYLSCTCRSASVNYWQTAYIELSLPTSKDPKDTVLRFMSFDYDPAEEYLGGFWGDSDPTPAGATYEMFKEEFISYFHGKEASYLQSLSTVWDIEESDYTSGEEREDLDIDVFSGSSVSTNNIIRIIDAILDYHATDEFFQ